MINSTAVNSTTTELPGPVALHLQYYYGIHAYEWDRDRRKMSNYGPQPFLYFSWESAAKIKVYIGAYKTG